MLLCKICLCFTFFFCQSAHFLDSVSENSLPASTFEPLKILKENSQYPPAARNCELGRGRDGESALEGKFKHYYPAILRELVKKRFKVENLETVEQQLECRRIRSLMRGGMRPDNYVEWYQTQIYIEEIEREMSMKFYNQRNIALCKSGSDFSDCIELFTLDVPGLIEKRPHVMPGDSIFFRNSGQTTPIYEAVVHRISEETVYLGFSENFTRDFDDTNLLDVQFWFDRTTIVREHIALSHAHKIRHILFPKEPQTPLEDKADLTFFDKRINTNKEQSHAVTAIVHNYSEKAPYILFGPPGTGKTLTIVEAIKQIHKIQSNCHILVSGPSNSSCDLITERLLADIPQKHILRVNAKSRVVGSIPAAVRRVSLIEEAVILQPTIDLLATYRIIVTTFMTASKVVPILLPREYSAFNKFSHVFLDECGHGEEPSALLPLLGGAKQVVLAGDPRQLGPVIQSSICRTDGNFFKGTGLDQSLLERLMKLPMYLPQPAEGKYNGRVVTKLLDNYRSHSAILSVPNQLFYDSELRSCADKKLVNHFLKWSALPNKNIPIIFHGVDGKDAREGSSPSYFNPHEVSRVVSYVSMLKNSKFDINPKDIGIVAPYRTQIKKIKAALKTKFNHWAAPMRVGSPEEFQGDERKVIILSTVRASGELLLDDIYKQLGFMRNPKVIYSHNRA